MEVIKIKVKLILPLCILCVLLFPTAVYAKSAAVTIPSFPVTVNGQPMESKYNQYPLLLYKDITYFPMAYDYARFLGVKANWYKTCREYGGKGVLFVGAAEDRAKELKIISTKTPNQKRYTATVAEYGIALNTTIAGKFLDNIKEEYPILNFRGVTYFPLTWRFAVEEFGWKYSYDKQNGLRIESGDSFRPVISDGIIGSTLPRTMWTDFYYGKEYYVGYSLSGFNKDELFIVRKRGEPERKFSLGDQIQGDYYAVISEPSIDGNIFSVECKKYTSDSKESKVLLQINLDTEKVVAEEDRTDEPSNRK
jgi:hypothetical protein